MKLLYCGLKYDYGDKNKGFSFEHINFFNTLSKMSAIKKLDYLPTDEVIKNFGKDYLNETIVEKARLTQDFQEKCTPGYYNNEGQPNPLALNTFYGGGPIEFFSLMDKWRSKGNLQGLELKN